MKGELYKGGGFTWGKKQSRICYVYLIHCVGSSFYKIGISIQPCKRLKDLQAANPFDLQLLDVTEHKSVNEALKIESGLHMMFADKCVRNEWFNLEHDDVMLAKKRMQPVLPPPPIEYKPSIYDVY